MPIGCPMDLGTRESDAGQKVLVVVSWSRTVSPCVDCRYRRVGARLSAVYSPRSRRLDVEPEAQGLLHELLVDTV